MVRIQPFKAIFYNTSKAGAIENLIAPPYDVLDSTKANKLAQKSPFNVIHITFSLSADSNFYSSAKEKFFQWLKEGVLKKTSEEGIYFYEVNFEYILGGRKRKVARRGFFASLGLSNYSKGEVLPHERTLSEPKKDRLALLRSVRANLSPIFCLYSDPSLEIINALAEAEKKEPIFEFCDDEGFEHKFFSIYDQNLLQKISDYFAQKRVYIADGHHRYETALEYWRELLAKGDKWAKQAGWIMSYFTPIEEAGLVIFPYHRLLRNLSSVQLDGLVERVSEYFYTHLIFDHLDKETIWEVMRKIEELNDREMIMIDNERRVWLISLKENYQQEFFNFLDVEILEELVLTRILMISREEILGEKVVSYETSEERIAEKIFSQEYQLAFLLKPISAQKVIERAEQAKAMPEKSTYFYPKLPSGLVFRLILDE